MTITLSSKRIEAVTDVHKAGKSWTLQGGLKEEASDNLADLTSKAAQMDFRDEEGKLLVSIRSGQGITLKDGSEDHNYSLHLTSAQTMKFNGSKIVEADFWLLDGLDGDPVFNLEMRIERTQTQWLPTSS